MVKLRLSFALCLVVLLRCTGIVSGGAGQDAGNPGLDGGQVDAGSVDAGSQPPDAGLDAGTVVDSGAVSDSGTVVSDAGTGSSDSGFGIGLPDGGTIFNPYYTTPKWKLWTLDASVVHYTGFNLGDPVMKSGDFIATPVATRKFPDPAVNSLPSPFIALQTMSTQPAIAGFWDDGYATRDGAHTVLGNGWSDPWGNAIDLTGQYVRVPFGSCTPTDMLRLGINFTSESYSGSGHQLISSSFSMLYTEQYFSFANTVRATPAYLSYAETIADRGIDSYDALYSHSFNSVGRSGSELGALFKMLVAGGYLPRATKDLLKWHGAYAMVMINLFRQTLPYAEADGAAVGIASEMLQRPAYFSNGWNTSQEFIPRNPVYHQYDESQHLYRMIQAAKAMDVAPPIALLKVLGITVTKNGATLVDNALTDPRLRTASKTLARVWGNDGETITLRIDVGSSYDLQGRALTAAWHTVYPEQRNVTIAREAGTIWRITVAHDPALPKGRIPVGLFVNNGALDSPPAFVNFYWAEAGQPETPPYVAPSNPISNNEVQKNRRPLFTSSLGSDFVNVKPGATAAFDLTCTDPDGFPVRYYRWLNEVGTLGGSHFGFTVPASDPGLVYPIHLVCSDGTGGYDSLLARVVVTPNDGALPSPWQSTVFGLPEAAGSASHDAGVFELVGNGPSIGPQDHGRIVFQPMSGDIELTAKVVDLSVDGSTASSAARGGVMLRESLGGGSREVFAYAQGNSKSSTPLTMGANVRASADSTPGGKVRDPVRLTQPTYLKAIRRGTALVGLGSSDGQVWEQLWGASAGLGTTLQAGLAVISGDTKRGDAIGYARGRFEVWPDPAVATPVVSLAGTATNNTYTYTTKATVTLLAGSATQTLRYTLDGSAPTGTSTLYSAPFDLTTVGDTVLSVKAFEGSNPSGTTVMTIKVVP